jgi:hypothetical protein
MGEWRYSSTFLDLYTSWRWGVLYPPERVLGTCRIGGWVDPTADLSRAIAQAVSRWLPTAAARVRSRLFSSEICGGQSGAGAGFLRVLQFPLPIFIPPNSRSSQSPGAGYNKPVGGRRAEWTQFDSTPPTKKIKKKYRMSFVPAGNWTPSVELLARRYTD